jgi:DNA primase
LEEELDFKQLQKSGRIGRIVLNLGTKQGRTEGFIEIPSSLDKVETAIIAATLETVDRVGSCTANISLDKIEDVRKEKRDSISKRALEIMRQWDVSPDITNLADQISKSAKRDKPIKFGPDKLTAGPDVLNRDDIILVEGRADVLKLMKFDITNSIELKGSKVSPTIRTLCKKKTVTVLLDGDRGGDLLLKELIATTSIDFVARAPMRKEIEDLSKQEILFALNNKVEVRDAKFLTEDMSIEDFIDDISEKPGMTTNSTKTLKRYSKPSRVRGEKVEAKVETKVEPKVEKTKIEQKQLETDQPSKKTRYIKKSAEVVAEEKQDVKPKSSDKKLSRYKKQRDKTNGKSRKRQRDDSRYKKSSKKFKPFVPDELKTQVDSVKQTFNAVFLNDNYQIISKVPTAEAYKHLEQNSTISSIILDGVITNRFVSLANTKEVKYIIGASIGDLDDEVKNTKDLVYVSYSRL